MAFGEGITVRRLIDLLAIVVLIVGFSSATAAAAPASAAVTHCIQQVQPNGGGMGSVRCYSTFGLAVAAATGDPAYANLDQAGVTTRIERTVATNPDASVLLATEWKDSGFQNSSYSWYGTTKCTSGYYYAFDHMASGWNDIVSSARSWGGNGCNHSYHYENSYENRYVNGAQIDCGYCTSMGAMNDQTSSVKVTY